VRMWRFWPFLASSLYPEVKWIGKIPDEKLEEMNKQYGWATCPTCKQGKLVVKKSNARGRPSYFLWCNRYPDCKHLESLPWEKSSGYQKKSSKISKKIWSKKNVVKKTAKR
jgi:ssDNA-binding Zn-finger/Zn-ribbon topoisomerase 1